MWIVRQNVRQVVQQFITRSTRDGIEPWTFRLSVGFGSHHRDLAVGLDDGRTVSGPLHRSAPVLRRGERVVCLAHGNDLAVPGLQSEA